MDDTKIRLEAATAALATAQEEAAAARDRLSSERDARAPLLRTLAQTEPSDKTFTKKSTAAEESRLRIEALELRVGLLDGEVAEAQVALSAAAAEAERARVATERAKAEGLRARLAEDAKQLEALVRSTRSSLVARVRAHRAILKELNRVAESVFKAEHADDSYADFYDHRPRSFWALNGRPIDTEKLLGAAGVLAKLEEVVDSVDQATWRAAQPPPPPDPMQVAAARQAEELVQAALKREAEEAKARQLRAQRAQSLSADQLDQIMASATTAALVQDAIDRKAERDGPPEAFRGDFQPKIG